MNQKVFVGNLPWSVRDQHIKEAFDKFGETLECAVILEKHTGRSRGFGFVTYVNSKSAQDAVDAMHGVSFGLDDNERQINVSLAQSKVKVAITNHETMTEAA